MKQNNESLKKNCSDYQKNLSKSLVEEDYRILAYKAKAPVSYREDLHAVSVPKFKTPIKTKRIVRNIPTVPERVLDAPGILDDYYLNLLDWSSSNILAVALANSVYLWNGNSGQVTELCTLNDGDYIGSLSWIGDGSVLALGDSNGTVQLWDVQNEKKLRSMSGHQARVGCLAWNNHILSSGSRTGIIHNSDVRISSHRVASLEFHSQEVCGLKWSFDGSQLAAGGNDNMVSVWNAAASLDYSFSAHTAAVKAIAWCPWQNRLLATGGGSHDRCIRFWDTQSGTNLHSIDTGSQVTAIAFAKDSRELVSSHGFADNQLIFWRYPSMTKLAEISAHDSRILHMSISPDHSTIVTGAADENLKFWKAFDRKDNVNLPSKSPKKSILIR